MPPYVVLIVTRSTEYQNWLEQILADRYELTYVLPHITALEKISFRPGAILFAPGSDGIGFVQSISSTFKKTPIILLSKETGPKDVTTAFRHGASDYLIQPDSEEILNSLDRYLPIQATRGFVSKFLEKVRDILAVIRENRPESLTLRGGTQLGFIPNPFFNSPKILLQGEDPLDTTPLPDLPVLKVQLLGPFKASIQGQFIPPIKSRKGQGVLAYLLYHQKRIPREKLMGHFWKGVSGQSARNSLNVALHGTRKVFLSIDPNFDPISFKNGSYCINSDWDLEVDVVTFLQTWAQARAIEQHRGLDAAIESYQKAAKVYRGDFLEEDVQNNWVREERENLRETYLFILERLSQHHLQREAYESALILNRKILNIDPCRETIHKQIMVCLHQLGKRNLALKQYQKCCHILKKELNVTPSQETQTLFENIKSNLI